MKIMILHASAGEGHRRAAIAIEAALLRAGVPRADIEVADALDFGSSFFKKSYTGFYFWCVKNFPGMWGVFYNLLDNPVIYGLMYPIRRIYNAWHGRKLLQHVMRVWPDWIICTHFFSTEILGHAKAAGKQIGFLSVVVTDFHPVRVWIHPGVDHYWVLSEEAKQTLIARGTKPEAITNGGFPITSEFQRSGNRSEILKRYQFTEERLTILLTMGSFGLGEQAEILEKLAKFREKIQCFVVCGRNQTLYDDLTSKSHAFPVKIFGFIDFMSDLMDAADVMVAKPGGATSAESMAKGVPMILTGVIPGQETENLKYLLKENAVFSAQTPDAIIEVLESIVDNRELLAEKKRVCDRLCNPRAADDLAQIRFQLKGKHG